jgi:hypothetical protein
MTTLRSMKVTGMVLVSGRTYRIVRVTAGVYEAVRLIDDKRMGTFSSTSPRRLAEAWDEQLLGQIAQAALRQARTSWGKIQAAPTVAADGEPQTRG